ncbi:MAG: PAS domain S-box protein [Methanoregula sp.]|jgi:PAS domain S-box-containing protein|nr:PAS domain S-box protein [Methanoregula sp.]
MVTKKKAAIKKKPPAARVSTRSLRDTAEKKLNQSPWVKPGMKGLTAEELIHELQVHQIELEMQAEELRRSQLALTESRDEYLDLYDFAPLGYFTLTGTALISRTNLTAAMLLGVERNRLNNARLRTYIVPEDLETWDQYFSDLKKTDSKLTATIRLKRADTSVFPARLESIRLGSSDGQSIRVAVSDISDLVKAETELKDTRDMILLQARMLDAVGDAVIAVDPDHKIIFWNNAATRMYGWKPEEVLGHDTIEVTVPEISKDDARKIISQLDSGESWSGEYRVHHRDGHEFPVHVTDSPVFDDNNNLIAIIGAYHDISRQQRIRDTLQNNEDDLLRARELLEAVTKATDVIIAAQDVNFRYIYFNQTYKEDIKRLTGRELTLGTSMIDVFAGTPEEQKRSEKEWRKVLNGEQVDQRIEFNAPGKPSRIYRVLHTPLRDAQGKIVGAGEVAFDIPRFVQVEDSLRETKEYLDNLFTCANAPIIVWDPQFRITRFNHAFEHLTGRSAHEVMGKHFGILLLENYLAEAMDLIKKTMGGERWDSVEIPILHKNGEIRTVLWNSASIYGSDGKNLVSVIAQGQDISKRKRIESEYRLRAADYAELNVILQQEIWQRKESDTTLKNTLSLLHASLESTADGTLVVNEQGRITSYNQNFITMWGIPRDLLERGDDEEVTKYVLPQLKNPWGVYCQYQRSQCSHRAGEL